MEQKSAQLIGKTHCSPCDTRTAHREDMLVHYVGVGRVQTAASSTFKSHSIKQHTRVTLICSVELLRLQKHVLHWRSTENASVETLGSGLWRRYFHTSCQYSPCKFSTPNLTSHATIPRTATQKCISTAWTDLKPVV